MTTLIKHNMDNNFASPAHKVRKIVRGDDKNYTAYQNILKHSTGSRIIGIPKHIRLQMQHIQVKQKEQLAKQKRMEEEDKKPYNVSQSFHTNNPQRRVMPPHKPRYPMSQSTQSTALTPGRNNGMSSSSNRNKRTRTGLSPALRALGFEESEYATENSRLRNKLPPAFKLDDHEESVSEEENDEGSFLDEHTVSSDEEGGAEEAEEEENKDEFFDSRALNPMMLTNSHLDGDVGNHNDSDGGHNEKDKDNNINDESDIVGEKNKNVSFLFRRSSVESTNDDDLSGSMTRSTSWTHLVSPMLAPSESPSFIASKPRTISATSFASAGDFYDEDDDIFADDIDDGFVELDL